jgi:hypothetical protein
VELSDSDCLIEESNIINNERDGLIIWSGEVQIIGNVVTHNKDTGLRVYNIKDVISCQEIILQTMVLITQIYWVNPVRSCSRYAKEVGRVLKATLRGTSARKITPGLRGL